MTPKSLLLTVNILPVFNKVSPGRFIFETEKKEWELY